MKHTKKWFVLLLAVLLVIAVLQTSFAAADDVIASGSAGAGVSWTLTAGGLLTVSGNGPVVDEEEVEIDEYGTECISKIDCVGWQLDRAFEEQTKGYSDEQRIRARFSFVQEIVVEEGITDIPDGEFSDFSPRRITLPASLTSIRSGIVNARFAESLTICNKDVEVNGNIAISGYRQGAEPYASLDEAIEAQISFETETEKINTIQGILYELGSAYGLKLGIDDSITAEEYLDAVNEYYGTDLDSLDAVIAYCLETINQNLGTDYASADAVYTLVDGEDGSCLECDPVPEEQIGAMFDAIDIEDRLTDMYLGVQEYDEATAYTWLSVRAPSGSGAENSAKISGLPFEAISGAGATDNTFFGKVRQFFGKIKAFVIRIFNWVKLYFSLLKK